MGEPKRAPSAGGPAYEPHPDDSEYFLEPGGEELLQVDGEEYLRWLATGEGDPFRERSS